MEIVSYRPARPGGNTRAYLDVRFDNGLFVREMKLVQTRGGMRVYGPSTSHATLVAVSPALADKIIEEAVAHADAR